MKKLSKLQNRNGNTHVQEWACQQLERNVFMPTMCLAVNSVSVADVLCELIPMTDISRRFVLPHHEMKDWERFYRFPRYLWKRLLGDVQFQGVSLWAIWRTGVLLPRLSGDRMKRILGDFSKEDQQAVLSEVLTGRLRLKW